MTFDDDEQRAAFERVLPLVRMRAGADYGCTCDWCMYRSYQLLNDKADPGLPTSETAGHCLHQGPALETIH